MRAAKSASRSGVIGFLVACVVAACGDDGGRGGSEDGGADLDATFSEDAASGDGDGDGDGDAGDGLDAAMDGSTDGGEPAPLAPDALLPLAWSGRRLSAHVLGAAPAYDPSTFITFFDRELDVECSFAPASDGTLRCMPITGSVQLARYADEACTEALYTDNLVTPCEEPPLWARVADESEPGLCGAGFIRVFPLVPATEPEQHYTSFTGDCEGPLPGATSPAGVFAHGPELEPSAMVEATVVRRETGDGLRLLVLETEDGGGVAYSIEDPDYGVCWPREVRDLGVRCIQSSVGFADTSDGHGWLWADDTCTEEPLAYSVETTRDLVCRGMAVHGLLSDGEGELEQLIELGERVSGTVYDFFSGCTELNAEQRALFVTSRLGPAVGEGDLPELTIARRGTGELHMAHYATASGVLLQEVDPRQFYDTARDASCRAWQTASDDYRCLPEDGVYQTDEDALSSFADPACEQPLLVEQGAEKPELFLITRRDFCTRVGTPDRALSLHAVGDEHTGTVYTRTAEGCEPVVEPADTLYRIGEDLVDDYPALGVAELAPPRD